MSYCRPTIVEFNSEKDANEASADYAENKVLKELSANLAALMVVKN